jgi:PPP family 3-phenylpropionic acid transporter
MQLAVDRSARYFCFAVAPFCAAQHYRAPPVAAMQRMNPSHSSQIASYRLLTVPVRLALFYAAMFSVSGVHQPFWPVWLKAHGQSPSAIGVLLAAGVCARLLANPLVADLADRRGQRRLPIVLLSWASLAGFALFAFTSGFAALFALSVLFGALWAPIGPLGDSLTLHAVYAERLDYGRIRLWGSISFMLCTSGAGWLIGAYGADMVLALVLGGLLLNALTCHWLPDRRVESADAASGAPTRRLLLAPLFWLLLVGTGLVQASHTVYYGFFTLHLQSVGYGDGTIGMLWAEGVVAEIVLFYFSGTLLRHVRPTQLLLLGAIAAVIRWPITAETAALPVLIAVQILHAFTFGAAHLGAMHFMARAVPPALSASAQSLYSALVGGVALGLTLLAAGPLFERFAAGAFYYMAAMAVAGGFCCALLDRLWRGRQIVR